MGGPGIIHPHRQQRPHHSATVHWEGRQHVESDQKHVYQHQPPQKRAAGEGEFTNRGKRSGQFQPDVEQQGNHHIHRWAGQGHPEFLAGILRHFFQPGHSADRQQGDVGGLDAVFLCRQGMTELVQHHAEENHQYKNDPIDRLQHILARCPVTVADPEDDQ